MVKEDDTTTIIKEDGEPEKVQKDTALPETDTTGTPQDMVELKETAPEGQEEPTPVEPEVMEDYILAPPTVRVYGFVPLDEVSLEKYGLEMGISGLLGLAKDSAEREDWDSMEDSLKRIANVYFGEEKIPEDVRKDMERIRNAKVISCLEKAREYVGTKPSMVDRWLSEIGDAEGNVKEAVYDFKICAYLEFMEGEFARILREAASVTNLSDRPMGTTLGHLAVNLRQMDASFTPVAEQMEYMKSRADGMGMDGSQFEGPMYESRIELVEDLGRARENFYSATVDWSMGMAHKCGNIGDWASQERYLKTALEYSKKLQIGE